MIIFLAKIVAIIVDRLKAEQGSDHEFAFRSVDDLPSWMLVPESDFAKKTVELVAKVAFEPEE